jgi:hypothetical protein
MDKNSFLYGTSRYRGHFSPKNLAFNNNLQEFATKIAYISSLHTGGRLSSEEAYQRIKELWVELKQSKNGLQI